MRTAAQVHAALNRLAKWRALLAGWQLGTRPAKDPECQAVRDHREVTLLLRAESSALANLLVRKGVLTSEEWLDQLGLEAEALGAAMAQRFPGVTATEYGLAFDVGMHETIQTWMKGWKP